MKRTLLERKLTLMIRTDEGVLEQGSTSVVTVQGEVLVIGTVVRSVGLLLKSTYLSSLGEAPIAVSHVLRARGSAPILEQQIVGELVGVTLETRCLLDHLGALQRAAESVTDIALSVDVADAQLEPLHRLAEV